MGTDDVLAIANQYLKRVKRSGPENIMASCPFHVQGDRTTTTFTMSLTRGLYFCFSCEAKGNLPMFLRNVGLSRTTIGQRYGTLIEEVGRHRAPAPNPLKPGVFTTDPLPEGLLGLFDFCPLGLLNEGFSEETLAAFDVGYDDKHHRVTYPLRDLAGNLVGISGRTIYEDVFPRYKLYDTEYKQWNLAERKTAKGALLWNAHAVYPEVYFGHCPSIVVVEGYKACMWLVQHGIKNTVALMGKYLSWEQRWMLERLGAPIYLMLDNDSAGWKGRDNAGRLLSKSMAVRIVNYDAPQPSDLPQEDLYEALDQATEYYSWLIQHPRGLPWPLAKTLP